MTTQIARRAREKVTPQFNEMFVAILEGHSEYTRDQIIIEMRQRSPQRP